MKCPLCRQDMTPGQLQSFDISDLYFVPDAPQEPRVTLKQRGFFRSMNFSRRGWICKACEMVFFDYKNRKP